MKNRNAYIIAGPNGSGKTTFATRFLPEYAKCDIFINADLIATGLSPFAPEKASLAAGKLVLQEIENYVRKHVDFGFESTLAGKTYARHFLNFKSKGYKIHIFFLWIPDSKLSKARIKERVKAGGHNVPAKDVDRRFKRSVVNFFNTYRPIADTWILFDNSESKPNKIAEKMNSSIEIIKKEIFQKLLTTYKIEI